VKDDWRTYIQRALRRVPAGKVPAWYPGRRGIRAKAGVVKEKPGSKEGTLEEIRVLLQLRSLLDKTLEGEKNHMRNILRRQREFRHKLKEFNFNHNKPVRVLRDKKFDLKLLSELGLWDLKKNKTTFHKDQNTIAMS
jgi:hypothetical protein